MVSLKGAVLYDAGGYGMLGFGHAPAAVLEAMARPQVMANVMTSNLAQHRFTGMLRREIGHTRGGCPYTRFMCLNSGSEAVGLTTRIVDINAKLQTEPGARHAGATIKRVVVKGSFHGRTDRPGLYSDSSRRTYVQHLTSYRGEDSVIAIAPYDVAALRRAFADAATRGWFIEAVFLEPVMGEGDPGRALPVEFYSAARELTRAHGSLLLIDSIQAGPARARGALAGRLSRLRRRRAAGHGNLFQGAQRRAVPAVGAGGDHARGRPVPQGRVRQHHDNQSARARRGLRHAGPSHPADAREHPRARRTGPAQARTPEERTRTAALITRVQGTGLLFSCELASQFKCYGAGSTEEWLRQRGVNVIHGGENSLRFTPHFAMDEEELDLLVSMVGRALREGPQREQASAA